jgi:glutamate/tyrosine decarboxylase-like PLP-dependent enzyme
MIAHLFNAPLGESETAVGVGTVGSSEAIMLAGLAFKRRWQNKRRAEGKPFDKPNIVTGANVQVMIHLFCCLAGSAFESCYYPQQGNKTTNRL